MPYDGSGNFSRDYNWQSDRDNNIHIQAARMDGEFDNFSGGMNLAFLRTGIVPMQGNLNLGSNSIIGLAAGSAGASALRFADDATTGFFLNGAGKFSIASTGVERLQANSTGVIVTGTATVSGASTFSSTVNVVGALTQAGQQVWHAGNLNPALLAPLASPVFTGIVTVNSATPSKLLLKGDNSPTITAYNASNVAIGNVAFGAGFAALQCISGNVSLTASGVNSLTATSTGVTVTGTLNSTGTLSQNGAAVWHSSNLNPALLAPLASPALTGTPTAPTATAGTNTTQLATTAFVTTAISGVSGFAPLASPAFTGTPTAPTAAGGTNTTQLATTAFVSSAITTLNVAQYATIASPTFTGTASAPTATAGTNTTQLATTAFVGTAITNIGIGSYAPLASPTFTGIPVAPTATAGTSSTQLATTAFVQASNALQAPLASPTFTGTPAAPTPAGGNNSTQIATTAFISNALSTFAPIASPAFTGNPTATTQATADNSTRLSTTAFVKAVVTVYAPLASPALTGTPTTNGNEVGTREVLQVTKAAAFTFDATMDGGHVYYTGAAVAATINPNATTALPIGMAVSIVNDGSGVLTITRGAAVALIWSGSDANRALAVGGMASILKVGTNRWFISGVGLS